MKVMRLLSTLVVMLFTVSAANAMSKDIVDTAADAGQFKTLVAAVKAAGLVDTLKGDGPFTVFAPTDEAFAKIPAETIKELLKPENKAKLASILTYHVVPGRIMSADIAGKTAERVLRAPVAGTLQCPNASRNSASWSWLMPMPWSSTVMV